MRAIITHDVLPLNDTINITDLDVIKVTLLHAAFVTILMVFLFLGFGLLILFVEVNMSLMCFQLAFLTEFTVTEFTLKSLPSLVVNHTMLLQIFFFWKYFHAVWALVLEFSRLSLLDLLGLVFNQYMLNKL